MCTVPVPNFSSVEYLYLEVKKMRLLLLGLKMKQDIQCPGLALPDAIKEWTACRIIQLVMRWHAVKDPPVGIRCFFDPGSGIRDG